MENVETGNDVSGETGSGNEPGKEPETWAGNETVPEHGTETRPEPEDKTGTGTEGETEPEGETETGTEGEMEAGTGVETETETGSLTESLFPSNDTAPPADGQLGHISFQLDTIIFLLLFVWAERKLKYIFKNFSARKYKE